jgi:excisionase family DNA binding protein
MLAKGELPFFKLGGKLIRIKVEDVENYEAKGGSSG